MSAEQLRAQIPASTDPDRLEREAQRLEGGRAIFATTFQPSSLSICTGADSLTFHPDGRVTASEGLKPEGAARDLVDLLMKHGWLKYAPASYTADRTVTSGLRESGEYSGVSG